MNPALRRAVSEASVEAQAAGEGGLGARLPALNGLERPTARQGGRFDMSPGPARASAAPASLAVLRDGAVRVKRVERCACGEPIVQETGRTVLATVKRHNRGTSHRVWRLARGIA